MIFSDFKMETRSTENKKKTTLIHADRLYCSFCPKKFTTIGNKKRHEKRHLGQFDYTCGNCSASFLCEESLISHTDECNDLHDALWCRFCDFHTKRQDALQKHEESHFTANVKKEK